MVAGEELILNSIGGVEVDLGNELVAANDELRSQ